MWRGSYRREAERQRDSETGRRGGREWLSNELAEWLIFPFLRRGIPSQLSSATAQPLASTDIVCGYQPTPHQKCRKEGILLALALCSAA